MVSDFLDILEALKPTIEDDFRAWEDDEDGDPSILVTFGSDGNEWSFQTGDNSYSGGAYFYPHWGVVALYRDSDCFSLALDAYDQIMDALAYDEPEEA